MNNAFTPNAFPPGRPVMIRPSAHQSALKIILGIFFAMIVALLGLVVLVLIGAGVSACSADCSRQSHRRTNHWIGAQNKKLTAVS